MFGRLSAAALHGASSRPALALAALAAAAAADGLDGGGLGAGAAETKELAGDADAASAAAAASRKPAASSAAPRRRLLSVPVLASVELVLASLAGAKRAPVTWQYSQIKYSLTVPSEAVAAAVVATVAMGYEATVRMTVYLPSESGSALGGVALASGVPSAFADVPTEEATRFILEVSHGTSAVTNYTVAVVRSTITSSYELVFPDPAEGVPPTATLAGLAVYDTHGAMARMKPLYFTPQRSQYIVSVGAGADWAWAVASKNDPSATLELRVNGQEWLSIESGLGTTLHSVPDYGWLLFEVKVLSPSAAALGHAPLVYQALVARQAICHERCRSCFGSGEHECLRCRAPFVLNRGKCEATGCPTNAYFEWESYQCRSCHASCAQCTGPGELACRLCPALSFLNPTSPEDATGPCVSACPPRTFAHPPSRRCRAPPAAVVKTFYVRCTFRNSFKAAQSDTRLQQSILNTSAFVLGLSLSDVRPYSIGEAGGEGPAGQRLQIMIEVISPFLQKSEADRISIDTWFGAFEEPVDQVVTRTWDEVHPPLPKLPVEPLLPVWAWGLIASAGMTLLLLVPIYGLYFRRLDNAKKRYSARVGVDPQFVTAIVDQSPAWLIRRFVNKDLGHKQFVDRRPVD